MLPAGHVGHGERRARRGAHIETGELSLEFVELAPRRKVGYVGFGSNIVEVDAGSETERLHVEHVGDLGEIGLTA